MNLLATLSGIGVAMALGLAPAFAQEQLPADARLIVPGQ
jgi:hypothetical protein